MSLTEETPILKEGILALRQSDRDIDLLIDPRHEEIILLLARYIKEIELFNPAYGLVGTNDHQELIIRHILDSLAPLGIIFRLCKQAPPAALPAADAFSPGQSIDRPAHTRPQIVDVGSGAGLPGIPLAIVLSACDFTLIERMSRRAGFLLNTKAGLGLSNVTVEEGDIEKTATGRFSLVVFRALKPLDPKLLKCLFRVLTPGGLIVAYKGRREKIGEEMTPLEKWCGGWEAIPCPVPFLDEERHLLIIKPA